jgi:hypothetical protein
MLKCPHCHHRTISRWHDSLVCPNCHTRVKASKILRSLLLVTPMTLSAMVLTRWEPPPENWIIGIIIAFTGVIGLVLTYTIPRYKVAAR